MIGHRYFGRVESAALAALVVREDGRGCAIVSTEEMRRCGVRLAPGDRVEFAIRAAAGMPQAVDIELAERNGARHRIW